MALFSDIDWTILLIAGAFLLMGQRNGEMLRTLGRWYGRAGRMKQELLAEFTRAADLPPTAPGAGLTIRGALLGLDPPTSATRGVPAAVARPAPTPPVLLPVGPPWAIGHPTPTWSLTVPALPPDEEGPR